MVLKTIFMYLMAPDVKNPTDVEMSVCVHVFVLQLEQFNYQKTVTSRSARSGSRNYQEPSPEPPKRAFPASVWRWVEEKAASQGQGVLVPAKGFVR